MTTLEKLSYCKSHGVSINYIANLLELSPATLTKWINGQKGITKRNEKAIELTLQNFAKDLWLNIGDNNDGDI